MYSLIDTLVGIVSKYTNSQTPKRNNIISIKAIRSGSQFFNLGTMISSVMAFLSIAVCNKSKANFIFSAPTKSMKSICPGFWI